MSFLTRIWFSEERLRNVSLHLPKNVGVAAVTPPWQRMHLWDICHCFSACFGHLWETLYRDFGYTGSLPWTHGSKGGLHFILLLCLLRSFHSTLPLQPWEELGGCRAQSPASPPVGTLLVTPFLWWKISEALRSRCETSCCAGAGVNGVKLGWWWPHCCSPAGLVWGRTVLLGCV